MKISAILLCMLISFSICGKESKMKSVAGYADLLASKNVPKHTYKAFLLYDWYEDLRATLSAAKQQEFNLQDKSLARLSCLNKIRSESGYSKRQKFIAETLSANGPPPGFCQPLTMVARSNSSSQLPGSRGEFKTTDDMLLAYSIMDQNQRDQFNKLIDDNLKIELQSFEEKDFFADYVNLTEQGLLNKEISGDFASTNELEILQMERASEIHEILGEELEIPIFDYSQLYQNTRLQIEGLLQAQPEIDKKLEKKLNKSLEMIKTLEGNGGL